MMPLLVPVAAGDIDAVTDFLRDVDLTLSGLASDSTHLWIERDEAGYIVASTGFELSNHRQHALNHRQHALIRSVAVNPSARSKGSGSRLARFALDRVADGGARTAWLFSRRSGPFWQKLGFEHADSFELDQALRDTHQVRLFSESGQLDREVAWSRPLSR